MVSQYFINDLIEGAVNQKKWNRKRKGVCLFKQERNLVMRREE